MTSDAQVLQASPLLSGLAEGEVQNLLNTAQRRAYAPGERVVQEGTPSDCLFILVKGSVQVEKGEGQELVVLAVLEEEGDFFGEMSLIDILPRSAHIRALDQVEVLAFPKKALAALFTKTPRLQMTMILNIARILSLRLRAADARIAQLSRATQRGA
jgi:CRP-like cAMP-binding protein